MRTTTLAILLFISGQCAAQGYVGLGLGQLDYEEHDASLDLSLEDTAMAYKLYGGYRLGDAWAIEGYYGKTDDLSWSDSGFIPGLGNASATLSGDYEIIEIRGLARFNAFLVGLGYWDAELNANLRGTSDLTGPFSVPASDSDSGASVILGGEWDFDRWSLRAEYEWFDTDGTVDVFALGVGLHYRW